MTLPKNHEFRLPTNDRAPGKATLLNGLLREPAVDSPVATSTALRFLADSRSGDAAITAIIGVSEKKLSNVTGSSTMATRLGMVALMAAARG
jgi:hypothetical protein